MKQSAKRNGKYRIMENLEARYPEPATFNIRWRQEDRIKRNIEKIIIMNE